MPLGTHLHRLEIAIPILLGECPDLATHILRHHAHGLRPSHHLVGLRARLAQTHLPEVVRLEKEQGARDDVQLKFQLKINKYQNRGQVQRVKGER